MLKKMMYRKIMVATSLLLIMFMLYLIPTTNNEIKMKEIVEYENPNDLSVVYLLNEYDIFEMLCFKHQFNKEEIAYGFFENQVVYKNADIPQGTAILDYEDCTTFTANKLADGKEIDYNYTAASLCKIEKSIVNEKRKVAGEAGADADGKAIVTTDTNNIGFVDLSIYVEGWDTNVINESAGRQFSVDLEFSIA